MKAVRTLIATLAAVLISAGVQADEAPMKVGEKWIYQHEGPRPNDPEQRKVNGPLVRETTGVTGEGEARRWQLKATYGKDDENPSTALIDNRTLLHRIDVGSLVSIEFKPPIPTEWTMLEPGEKKTLESKLMVMGFEVPIKFEAERLADETVTVPAGKFEGCQRWRVVIHTTDMQGQPTKTRYDYWYHPKVNGTVKEIFTERLDTGNIVTGTSELISHVTE